MRRSDCGFTAEMLSAYLDDELDGEELRQTQQHLDACPRCRRVLSQLGRTSELLGNLPRRQLPEGFRGELRAALLEHKADRKATRPARSPPRGYLVAAMILVIILPAAAMFTHSVLGSSWMMMQAETADFAPEEDAADPRPSAHVELPPDVLMSDVVPRTEVLHLMVTDVSALTARLVDVSESAGATVREQEYSWSPGGKLLQSSLVLRVSPEEMGGLRQRLTHLGETVLYRVEGGVDDEPEVGMAVVPESAEREQEASDVVLRVTLYPYEVQAHEPLEAEPIVVRTLDTRRMPMTRRVFSAVADSWFLFGAHCTTAVLWALGHLPHLIFLFTLIVLAWLLTGSRRAHSR